MRPRHRRSCAPVQGLLGEVEIFEAGEALVIRRLLPHRPQYRGVGVVAEGMTLVPDVLVGEPFQHHPRFGELGSLISNLAPVRDGHAIAVERADDVLDVGVVDRVDVGGSKQQNIATAAAQPLLSARPNENSFLAM